VSNQLVTSRFVADLARELSASQARSAGRLSDQGTWHVTPKLNPQQYTSRVVADNFKFGADKNIIVALENDVLMANKRELSKVR
jgi:hypothetical protein